MTKIKSYSNKEDCSTYGFDKKQELIPKLREFLKTLGETWTDKEFWNPETGKDEGIGDYYDTVRCYEYKDCKVFLFFGMHKMYITLVFDKKNREKVVNKFIKIFKPEGVK